MLCLHSNFLRILDFFETRFRAALAVFFLVLSMGSGEVMAMEPEDFFTGDYLEVAKAIDRGDVRIIQLLSRRVDLNKRVDDKEMTLFVYAVGNRRLNVLRELITLGADPYLNVAGVGSPLSLAAMSDDPRLLVELLNAGCDPNTMSDDEPLLFIPQMQNRREMVKVLLDYKANINKPDVIGNTVLEQALSSKHYDMAMFLIEQGANVHAKNDNGVSVAYSLEWEMKRISTDSPSAKKLQKIKSMMEARGVNFPAAPPPKK
jgi:uncharacterized protein